MPFSEEHAPKLHELNEEYELSSGLEEDVIWSRDVAPLLAHLPRQVFEIWNYTFTEMLNNAIDHSEGSWVAVHVGSDRDFTEITIHDDGVGIFRKIQAALKLADEKQAVLELAKGKFTTDRKRHSGLGVYFSSRMVDSFNLLSGKVYLSHEAASGHDWTMEEEEQSEGTTIFMRLANDSSRTTTQVYDQFSDGRPLTFSKTIVPLALAQNRSDKLVSRSQAKRVLARAEQFAHIVLDFTDIETIGQAFADEVFRVFVNSHPHVKVSTTKMSRRVAEMVHAVQHEANAQRKAARRAVPIGLRKSAGKKKAG